MGTRDQSKKLIGKARQGKLEGEEGCRPLITELIKMAVDLDYTEPPYFRTAMWEAAWKNHELIVKLLVEKGAQVNFADYEGRTALHEACYYGHMGVAEYLLEKGATIDVEDNYGQTPLFRAVQGGRHDIVSMLVDRGAKTNLVDGDEVTVQHCSAFNGEPQMSWWLYYKGAWRNRYEKPQPVKSPEKEKEKEGAEPQSPTSQGSPSGRRGSTSEAKANEAKANEAKEGDEQQASDTKAEKAEDE